MPASRNFRKILDKKLSHAFDTFLKLVLFIWSGTHKSAFLKHKDSVPQAAMNLTYHAVLINKCRSIGLTRKSKLLISI